MNQDVFLSLLALNVYNRGSTRSVFAGGSSIGDAIIRSPSSFGIPDAQLSAWENAGFQLLRMIGMAKRSSRAV